MKLSSKNILLAKALIELKARKENNPLRFIKPLSNPYLNQKEFIESKKKDLIVFGGNRSGKTLMGAYKTISLLLSKPNSDALAVTWADMLVPVLMKTYYELLPRTEVLYAEYSFRRGFNHKVVVFKNGSILRFKTYEQGRESFQGTAKDVIHLDEEAPEDILKECKARLIDKGGVLIRTMTPVNGLTYTYDEIINSNNPELEYWFWDTRHNPHIPQEDLVRIMEQYPEKEKDTRLTGRFNNLTSGLAYYNFSSDNIISKYEYDERLPIEIGCDFNIELMSWSISQSKEGIDYVFDSIELEDYANTQLMCDMLKERYGNNKGGLIFYLDFSANQRRPESSYSNYDIIKMNFPNAIIRANVIKNIKDRVDVVNLRLKDNFNVRKLFVLETCKRLIGDFQRVTWEILLNKNKAGKLTHASDGLSYMLYDKYSFYDNIKIKSAKY